MSGPHAPQIDIVKHRYNDDDARDLLDRRILEAVQPEHDKIHRAELIQSLSRSTLPLEHYVLYVATLHHIYDALERVVGRVKHHDAVAPVYSADLVRLPAIRADLAYYTGGDAHVDAWVAHTRTPATDKWAQRLDQLLVEGKEHMLVAHLYTRYMGDLSGGQIFRKKIPKLYNLEDGGKGVAFYEFRSIPDTKQFKHAYGTSINALGDSLSPEQQQDIIQEAKLSFELNYQMLTDLQNLATRGTLPSPLNPTVVERFRLVRNEVSSPIPLARSLPAAHPPVPAGAKVAQCPLRAIPGLDPKASGSLVALGLAFLGYALGTKAN